MPATVVSVLANHLTLSFTPPGGGTAVVAECQVINLQYTRPSVAQATLVPLGVITMGAAFALIVGWASRACGSSPGWLSAPGAVR